LVEVKVFERAVMMLVERYQDGHDFAQAQPPWASARFHTLPEQLLLP